MKPTMETTIQTTGSGSGTSRGRRRSRRRGRGRRRRRGGRVGGPKPKPRRRRRRRRRRLADYDYEAYADRGDPDLPATLPRGARIDAANVDGGVVFGGRASRGGAAAGMDPLDDGDGDGAGSESSRAAGVSSAAAFAPGVPGVGAPHAVRASGSTAPSTRVVLVSKPGEWPLAALQLASARANAPRVAPHVTALVFTRADLRRCEASRPRPDCFLDETFEARFPRDAELGAFLEGGGEGGGDDDWGGAEGVASIPMMTEEEAGRAEAAAGRGEAAAGVRASEVRAGPRQKLSPAALSFLDWRGAHAAHSLLAANVPAVVLGADAVFLRDPSASWRDAMRRFDVTVGSFVGDAEEAQRNADTSMVLAPATREARELVKLWLRGEGEAPSREAEESASENGLDSLFFTSGAYFNDVLAPTTAGHFRIHHAGARERANFVTARAGEAGDFDETSLVSAAFCRTAASKEGFLRRVLETEADARAVSEAEEAVISEAEFDEAVSDNRFSPSVLSDDVSLDITEWNADDEPGLGRGRGLEDAGSLTGASRRTRRKESRRASRRTARALERARRGGRRASLSSRAPTMRRTRRRWRPAAARAAPRARTRPRRSRRGSRGATGATRKSETRTSRESTPSPRTDASSGEPEGDDRPRGEDSVKHLEEYSVKHLRRYMKEFLSHPRAPRPRAFATHRSRPGVAPRANDRVGATSPPAWIIDSLAEARVPPSVERRGVASSVFRVVVGSPPPPPLEDGASAETPPLVTPRGGGSEPAPFLPLAKRRPLEDLSSSPGAGAHPLSAPAAPSGHRRFRFIFSEAFSFPRRRRSNAPPSPKSPRSAVSPRDPSSSSSLMK